MKSGKQRSRELKAQRARRREREDASRRTRAKSGIEIGQAPCNPVNLAPYNSYGEPPFVRRGFYLDTEFRCIDCNSIELWKATQQKWWYEVAKGHVETTAVRCRPCRVKERKRRDEARRIHLEGIAGKYEKGG